ncbi:MAG TPA: aminodeoxychorismate synthase component I [Gemmatimonadales bacterium]|nr:aminodeoxychorismate synthase component I [Gemmatimonadales bacterium]
MSREAALVEELLPAPDPLETCARFADLPFVLFLDSAADPEHLGRYSFLAADPATVVRSKGALTQELDPAGRWNRVAADPLARARELVAPFAAEPVRGLPPFQGGAAGYIGYDWGVTLERIPRTRYDDLAIPDVMLGLYDWVIAWDHPARHAWVISTGLPERRTAREARAVRRLAFVRERLAVRRTGGLADGTTGGLADGRTGGPAVQAAPSVRLSARPAVRQSAPSYPVPGPPGLRSNFTRAGYLQAVARVIEYVYAGDIFQANLSQRLQAPLAGTPFELYGRLRQRNPAPFAAYLDFGDLVVASSSPERFLRIRDGRRVETRPIKGTRPRGIGPEHDAALALALAESDKDRAENVMIVDLLRNDLSRVCRPGTVRVPELFALEHYQTVHHLVSTVEGELAPEHDAVDLVRAAFPGGSITGAPKVRAMQIIAEVEPTQRGVYCGSIGYLSVTGALDTSIVIRTCLALGRDVYFQAGGGIVADSDPDDEYAETLDKARGLTAALTP